MNTRTEGLRAVIYTRISRDDGNTEGAGPLERQLADCRMLSDLRRYEVVAEEEERGVSAYGEKKRPAWERVLGMVEDGQVDVIVAWHIDRMTRNMVDLERLILLTEEHNVRVATVTGDIDLTNETGKMVARILAAVARAEVERKATRQKRANLSRREEGQPWKSGWRSFGYTLQGEVVEDEAALIQASAQDLLNGVAIREVARQWRDSGISTPRSEKGAEGWTHNGVKSVMLNPKIAGYVTYRGEIVGDGAWDPVIDRETFALLTAKLSDPSRRTNGPGRKAANLLTGIATCEECGEGVVGGTVSVQRQENGKRVNVGRRAVYKCPNDHLNTHREDADRLVLAAFAVATQTLLPGLVLSIPSGGESAELVAESERKRHELVELAESHAAGRIPLVVLEKASASLSERLAEIDRLIETSEATDYDPRRLNGEALRRFDELDTEGKRAFLRRLTSISLHRKGKGTKNKPITEQVTMDVKVTDPKGEARWATVVRPGGDVRVPDGLAKPSDLLAATTQALA